MAKKNLPEEDRKKYNKYLEQLSDEASYADTIKIDAEEAVKKIEDKVREDEREKTEKKRNTEIAINLIKMNFPDEQVAQATGLPIDEVANLRKNI